MAISRAEMFTTDWTYSLFYLWCLKYENVHVLYSNACILLVEVIATFFPVMSPDCCTGEPLCAIVCLSAHCSTAQCISLVCVRDCLRFDGQKVCRSIRDEVQRRVEQVIHAHSLIFFLLPCLVNNELFNLRGKRSPFFPLLCVCLQRSKSYINERRGRIFSAV